MRVSDRDLGKGGTVEHNSLCTGSNWSRLDYNFLSLGDGNDDVLSHHPPRLRMVASDRGIHQRGVVPVLHGSRDRLPERLEPWGALLHDDRR